MTSSRLHGQFLLCRYPYLILFIHLSGLLFLNQIHKISRIVLTLDTIPYSITDSMDTSLSKLWEIVEEGGAQCAAVHGIAKSWA